MLRTSRSVEGSSGGNSDTFLLTGPAPAQPREVSEVLGSVTVADASKGKGPGCCSSTLGGSNWAEGAEEAPPPPPLHAAEEVALHFRRPCIPAMVIVLLVFASLAQSLSSTCIILFINMDLAHGPVEVTRYWMFVGFIGWFQPLIGSASDLLVIAKEKRRPLFILCAIGNTIIYSIFCFKPASTAQFAVFVAVSIVSNACTMGIYIPLNGILVEVGRSDAESPEETVARVSAVMPKAMVFRSLGALAGNVIHTCLILVLSVRAMLGISAITFAVLIPLVLVAPRALFLRPAAIRENFYKSVKEACVTVKESLASGDMRSDGVCFVVVLLFVFLYCVMPDAQVVYSNYLYGAFSFDAWFYSMNSCLSSLASIVGSYCFAAWMDYRAKREHLGGRLRTSIFFIFSIGCVAWAFAYFTNLLLCTGFIVDVLHIPPAVYVPVDNFVTMLLVRFAFMPTIVMAAEHAPKGLEATAFEVFSVASLGGGTISSLMTSFIAQGLGMSRGDYGNLWILLVISMVCRLVPIPLAYFLPQRRHGGAGTPGDGELMLAEGFRLDAIADGEEEGKEHLGDCHRDGISDHNGGKGRSYSKAAPVEPAG